jgi:hypothetical protein
MKLSTIALSLLPLLAPGMSLADNSLRHAVAIWVDQNLGQEVRTQIRSDYDRVMPILMQKASDPAFDAAVQGLGTMLYNKANVILQCVADALVQAGDGASPILQQEAKSKLEGCAKDATVQMTKTFQLSGYSANMNEVAVKCEMISRLFEREQEFPPYEFLQLTRPLLLDFKRFNDCLLSPS